MDDLLSQRNDGVLIEVVVLDGSRDGIDQITEILAGYQDLDAVHFVSHGTDGTVKLGDTLVEIGQSGRVRRRHCGME